MASMLSPHAQSLWAKKCRRGTLHWLPLVTHMSDSASLAKRLWNHWVSDGVKHAIATGISKDSCPLSLFVFLAAAHDLGKATPVFQAKRSACPELDRIIFDNTQSLGLPLRSQACFPNAKRTPHALATQAILLHSRCHKNVAVVLGAHHGKPSDSENYSIGIETYPDNFHLGPEGKSVWMAVQQELFNYALSLAGFDTAQSIPTPSMPAQVLLSGLVIITDWIASHEASFPYYSTYEIYPSSARDRTQLAWRKLALPPSWQANNCWMKNDLYGARFSVKPSTMQTEVSRIASSVANPGVMVLEAPMGAGKTEAALVAAEIFAHKAKRSGVFFALPTQATSDGIFPRFLSWLKHLDANGAHSLRLIHGRAQFNDLYQALVYGADSEDGESKVIVHEWFAGKKKAMLDDFAIGTIDQLLLSALKQKHVMLRHLGLANKVVVIDECHAYDAYMSQYLFTALRWLGIYRVPVIILSATLPARQRQLIVESYLNKPAGTTKQRDPLGRGTPAPSPTQAWATQPEYPIVTYTDGYDVYQSALPHGDVVRSVAVRDLREDNLLGLLKGLLREGGCAGIIVNTVSRAQALALELIKRFGRDVVLLLHARFIAPDRAEGERKLARELGRQAVDGRPHLRIVIGTQVLEQSLDIDFDVLLTDLCPMDLLLQRIGRLHRHPRGRPALLAQACCYVIGLSGDAFPDGTESVYSKYLLMRTRDCLPPEIKLPKDISPLVQEVYGNVSPHLQVCPEYQEALAQHNAHIQDMQVRAKHFRIANPWPDGSLVGWLQTSVFGASARTGEAAVRDSDESIEVVLVRRSQNGKLHFLPWIEGGHCIPQNEPPCEKTARAVAQCVVRLPYALCAPSAIEKTITVLEEAKARELYEWQSSSWLAGELFLILDSELATTLCGYRLSYHRDLGLMHRKED